MASNSIIVGVSQIGENIAVGQIKGRCARREPPHSGTGTHGTPTKGSMAAEDGNHPNLCSKENMEGNAQQKKTKIPSSLTSQPATKPN